MLTKRQLAENITRAFELGCDETSNFFKNQVEERMKSPKNVLVDQNKYAEKVLKQYYDRQAEDFNNEMIFNNL